MGIEQIFGIGFLMGFLGSAHCIGMCGPLVMALPFSQQKGVSKFLSISLYHIGKLMSYASLGLLVGIFGKQLFLIDSQQALSIVIGILMLVYVLWKFFIPIRFQSPLQGFFQAPILRVLSKVFASKQLGSFILVGFLNGLLPCGMVYLALGSAFATASIVHGSLFMVFFGLGTIPALLMLSLGGQLISFSFRQQVQKMLPVFIFSMGLVLILRGMNLGIPYLSPHLSANDSNISCHN